MSLVTRCWNAFSESVRIAGQKLLVAHKTEMVERGKRLCVIAVDDPKDGKQTCRITASPLSLRQLELSCTCKDFQAGRMCRHLWASIVHLDCTDIDDFGEKTGPL
ncbi:MAG TPA: SWIM zinc finger family protein, partial [Pirellulales bacterium]